MEAEVWILYVYLLLDPSSRRFNKMEYPKQFNTRGDCLMELQGLAKENILDARMGACEKQIVETYGKPIEKEA